MLTLKIIKCSRTFYRHKSQSTVTFGVSKILIVFMMLYSFLYFLIIQFCLWVRYQTSGLFLENFTLFTRYTSPLFHRLLALFHEVLNTIDKLVLVNSTKLGFKSGIYKSFVILLCTLLIPLFEGLIVSFKEILLNQHPLQLLPQ